mgnify:FL=1
MQHEIRQLTPERLPADVSVLLPSTTVRPSVAELRAMQDFLDRGLRGCGDDPTAMAEGIKRSHGKLRLSRQTIQKRTFQTRPW